ncbi:aspartate aminotransferase family protein [Ancylobacter dichloromethanicus]|uniref:Aspartate aminotransferase family protein n=1 Tax=Ancylobacter dichloromethanicus TaxID=518825 RepID=A0A9W6JA68_9HYPH|nr:pyridoxal-dependent decarboxylase [Ancylobacter dichloromethanicus]MBS7555075.1 aspartate aminotransferase family protein [Ancylobacter dichloromethanicus]GLK72284.1 aspartate aminotransferase family protein [Ancylobacter dichloromethanicus]
MTRLRTAIDDLGDATGEETGALLLAAARHAVTYRTAPRARQRAEATYGQSVAAFDDALPEDGETAEQVLDQLVRRAVPGLHAATGPRFFGWVIGNSHPVGVAADWLTAAWGQNTANHVAAPAAAAAETVAARWLLEVLRLPAESAVGFVTGATMASFVGLAAARGEVLRRAGWDVEAQGLFGAPPVRVLIGDEAHASVYSALHYLGFGKASLLRVASNAQGVMCPDAFAERLARDVPPGAPLIVVTQAGHVHTGATDAHERIVPLARARGGWVHVDGAFGLWARACPAHAPLAHGVEGADSWATDGHKWLQTPFDCGYVIVRDAGAHRRAMTIAASYLPPVSEHERDPSHYVPELSRRARGFATWALLRHFGSKGIAAMVARHCAQARLLAAGLAAEPGITVLNEVVLNQVAVRFGADGDGATGDALTRAAIAALQEDGTCFAGGAKWRGRWIMRLSVIGFSTTDDDIRLSAQAIIAAWRRVASTAAAS